MQYSFPSHVIANIRGKIHFLEGNIEETILIMYVKYEVKWK